MKKIDRFLKGIFNLPVKNSLLTLSILTLLGFQSIAQDRTVTGTVVDADDGTALPGVNVVEKGTQNGSVTDFDGNYRISVSEDATLVFTFVGYEKLEIPVGARSVIDVELALDIEELQEVVVVGYGAVQKKDLTGVVAKVEEDEFNKGAITNPAELLAGKAPGVSITTTGGVGNAPQVRIRGASSLLASSDPLYVIDGVIIDNRNTPPGQRNPLNFINTEDIEDITVLKDASAAAIYGSRGAKGVIIINTKRGKEGEPKISYDGYYTISDFQGEIENLKASEFRSLVNARYENLSERLGDAETNWFDEVTQTASGYKHALSLSDNNLYVSVMRQELNGIVRNDKIERNTFNVNYNRGFFEDQVTMNIALKNSFVRNNFGNNQIGAAYDMNPTLPVFDEDSPFGGYFEPQEVGELGVQNPVAQQDLQTNEGRSFRSLANMELTIKIPGIEGLSWTNNISYDLTTSKNRFFQPLDLFGVFGRGKLVYDEALKTSVLYETYGTYKTQIGSQHNLEFTAGYSYQTFNYELFKTDIDSLSNDQFGIFDPSIGRQLAIKPSAFYEIFKQQSYFGRVNYNLMEKYLLTVNFRADGSSQFGPDNRYGFFPSVALGWRIIDESFAEFLQRYFDDLKLRAGYGRLGNQEFQPFLYEKFYFQGTNDARYQFGSDYVRTLRPVAVDPNIRWEETETYNIGLDYTIVGGRLFGSLEFYRRNTNDMLFDAVLPAGINVGDRAVTNIASMTNEGIEFALSAVAIDRTDLKWNINFNIATNRNEVNQISGGDFEDVQFIPDGGISGDVGQTIQVITPGQPFKSFYVLKHKYEDGQPIPDEGLNSLINMYEDQNGDGIINENDLVPFEDANPDVEMGFTSNTQYKNWNLSFTLRSKLGNYVYNNVASSKGFFDRVDEIGGPNNIHTSVLETRFNDRQLLSSHYVENASFVRLDNITLSYNITALDFAKIRMYGTAQNVFVITGYSGLDPEVVDGIDNNLYPRTLNLIGGLNITF